MSKKKVDKQIAFWKSGANENLDAANVLFRNKHYDSCLFFCHLTLEKILKGLVVKNTGEPAPYVHDLARLADIAGIELDEDKTKSLRVITTFNIAGRYQEIKQSFHKSISRNYCERYFKITKNLFIWLKKQYLKK